MNTEPIRLELPQRPETTFRYGSRTYRLQGYKTGDYIFEQVKNSGAFYELETLEFVRSRRLSGTYVDIGANIGNHSLFFSAETDCDELVAIEGNQSVVPIWTHNVASNLKCAKPFRLSNGFVSNEEELYFNPDSGENIGCSFLSRVRLGEDSVSVRARTLDAVLSECRRISFIKLDVEGHEIEVLKSATNVLSSHSPEICVEAMDTPADELAGFLMAFQYLPVLTLSNGNLYFVKFPYWAFSAICSASRLPKQLATRLVWRLVRFFAVSAGLLPVRMFNRQVPSYSALRCNGS